MRVIAIQGTVTTKERDYYKKSTFLTNEHKKTVRKNIAVIVAI